MGKVAGTWKQDERTIADQFTQALRTVELDNHVCTRIPLSGSNNRRTDGSSHHGDVSLPDSIDSHIELKRRKTLAHQTLFEDAKKDAAKHGISEKNTILITKTLRQRGFTAIIEAELLFRLLSLPGARELMTIGKPLVATESGTTPGSPEKRTRKRRTKQANQDDL